MQEESSRSGKCGTTSSVPRAGSRPDLAELVIYAISVTGVLANSVIAPALPEIVRALHATGVGVGMIVATASLPGVIVAPVIGILSDRLGRREIVIPCLVVFGIGGLLGMVAPDFRVLIAARLLQGFGGAGLINLAVVILGDRYDGVERLRAIGRNAAVLTASIFVLPPIGGVLTAIGGWRATFAPFGLALVMAVVVARVLPSRRPVITDSLRQHLAGARPYVANRRVGAMCTAGFVAFVLVFGLMLAVLPLELSARFHAGPVVRGAILGLPAFGNVVTALAMGRIGSRYGTWQLVLTGYGIMAVTFAWIAAAPTIALTAAAVLVYGVGEALVFVSLQAYATSLAPTEYRGLVVAVWVAAVRAGQTLGPVLVGVSFGAGGSATPFALGAVVAGSGLLVAVAVRRRVSLVT